MKRRLVLVLVILMAAGGVVYWKTRATAQGLLLTGIVTTDDVIVSSEIQGRISHLAVKEGDTVTRGQLLALIEPRELAADRAFYQHSEESSKAQVTEAEAALRLQELQTRDQIRHEEAALASVEAQEREGTAALELARTNAERAESLFKQGIVSGQAHDDARIAYQEAQARLESLKKQVEAQRASVALARASEHEVEVRRSQLAAGRHQVAAAGAQKVRATVRLGYTEIHAPIAGIVAERAARVGEVVNPGQAIVSLINPDDLWIRADVEETYIDSIRMGDRFPARLPSGREYMGTVFFRGVDAAYATQRDVSRSKRDIKTFEIRLRVDNSERRLYPGLTAFVTIPATAVR
jgi:multidrug resistance efflux pump